MTDPAYTEWVSVVGLALWLDCTPRTVRRKLPELYAAGFPQPNAAIGKWYLPACRKWAEAEIVPGDDPLMRALDDSRQH